MTPLHIRPSPLLLAASGALGCSGNGMRCPKHPEDATVQYLLDELDSNEDGSFTEEDIQRGQSVMVFRFTQVNGKTRLVVSRDETADVLMHVYQQGATQEWGAKSLFGIWHEFTECSAQGWATPWFTNEDDQELLPATGAGPLYTLAFDIASIEHGNIGVEPTIDGHMVVVVDENGKVSGHLEGAASTEIISYLSQEPSGERVEVLSHAFRALPVDASN